jgi:rod shape-determining protein MreD
MTYGLYLAIPLMAIFAVLQSTVLPRIPIFGIVPQLWLVATIAWAILHGIRDGMIWALVGGLFIDLFSASPLGTTALALMAAVAVVTLVQRNLPQNRTFIPVLLTILGTFVFWFVYLLLLRIIVPIMVRNMEFLGIDTLVRGTNAPGLIADIASRFNPGGLIFQYVLVTALVHGFMGLAFYWGFYTFERFVRPRRVEI